jgi:hypothetical protein
MKYKCHICGETFEIPAGGEVICPLCYASGDVIEKLEDSIKELDRVIEILAKGS